MTTPTKHDLEGLPLLFNLIENNNKVSKIKSLLKSEKSLATARLNGVDDGHNALSLACQANNVEIVKLLVASYDVDVSLCHCWSGGVVSSCALIQELYFELTLCILLYLFFHPSVSFLGGLFFCRGTQVNTTCGLAMNTPLHEAAVNPYIDRSTNSGTLGSAKKANYTQHHASLKIIQFLIKHQANVNAVNTYENTPLHAVCIEGLEDCAQALLEAGANIAQTTGTATNSSTPLHLAAEYSHPNLVQFLLDQGADPTVLNDENKTCVEVAMETNVFLSEHHKQQTIEVLLAYMNNNDGGANNEPNGQLDGEEKSSARNDSRTTTSKDGTDNQGNDGVETSGNGSTRSNTIDAASSSEPRLSEDMTGEAARIAAKRGRDAAQKKQERRERKEREESEKQPTGCKCVVS